MLRLAALGVALLVLPTAASAREDYAQALADAFAGACVPQRLSFEGTKSQALAEGWTGVSRSEHPELAALMDKAEAALTADTDFKFTFAFEAFRREVAGAPHYLVVSRSESEPLQDLGAFKEIGCYVYNFEATSLPDPAPVSALTGKPIAHSVKQEGIKGHVWGPPCPMPRTGDTYLTYIAEGSAVVEQTGFSGLVLKFSTAEPDESEIVPETYC